MKAWAFAIAVFIQSVCVFATPNTRSLSDEKVSLGSLIFHDESLSNPPGKSCASCHKAEFAFADNAAFSAGAAEGSFSERNTPSLKYASFHVDFHHTDWGDYRGGLTWDGRFNSFEEQAASPFYNPKEMNSSQEGLASALRGTPYFDLLSKVYGSIVAKSDAQITLAAFDALAEFQRSQLFHSFDSKYDYSLAGLVQLTESEQRGEAVFRDKGACADCHMDHDSPNHKQIFTRHIYHNIGVGNVAYKLDPTSDGKTLFQPAPQFDEGLALNSNVKGEYRAKVKGVFRTPTLRNIELTAPYMHNGIFLSLVDVVEYYNNMPVHWRTEPVNFSPLLSSQLNLTEQEKRDLIAFMKTLTDGYSATSDMRRQLIDWRADMQSKGSDYLY